MAVKKTIAKAVPAKRASAERKASAAPASKKTTAAKPASAGKKPAASKIAPKKITGSAEILPSKTKMPAYKPVQKFDADREDLALAAPLLVFAGLVYDANLSTMGAAGMNHLVQAKIYIRRIKEGISAENEALENEKKKIWQLYRLGGAHFALMGYKGSGGMAIGKAILDGWASQKEKFDTGGITDEKLVQVANEARMLGNPPTEAMERLADEIAKKHGLIG